MESRLVPRLVLCDQRVQLKLVLRMLVLHPHRLNPRNHRLSPQPPKHLRPLCQIQAIRANTFGNSLACLAVQSKKLYKLWRCLVATWSMLRVSSSADRRASIYATDLQMTSLDEEMNDHEHREYGYGTRH